MKLVLFGATGKIGSRIAEEAIGRAHQLTAIARDLSRLTRWGYGSGESSPRGYPNLTVVTGDVLDAADVARVTRGHDVVISAVGPSGGQSAHMLVDAAHALIEGTTLAGVKRLVVLGGAGSLEVAPGVQAVDTAEFPAAWKANALAQREALAVYRHADLDWTYISPAGLIEAGARTAKYRVGHEQMLFDSEGKSRISYEDYAVAMLDEIESPRNVRRRITVAY